VGDRKRLRGDMTTAEIVLWKFISNKQLDGLRFRRQYGVDRYILDFYCPSLRLAIEVDGSIHDENEIRLKDEERDQVLLAIGIYTLRFKNQQIFDALPSVLKKIRETSTFLPLAKGEIKRGLIP